MIVMMASCGLLALVLAASCVPGLVSGLRISCGTRGAAIDIIFPDTDLRELYVCNKLAKSVVRCKLA